MLWLPLTPYTGISKCVAWNITILAKTSVDINHMAKNTTGDMPLILLIYYYCHVLQRCGSLVRNCTTSTNNNSKRPLTLKSMSPTYNEHAKLNARAPCYYRITTNYCVDVL